MALAGKIGSGKTSVAVALAHRLGWPRVGFGDYVRLEATRRELDPGSREVLQKLGESLLRQDLDGFCKAVLGQTDRASDGGLIVDGVRHVAVLDALHRLVSPTPVRLIYLAGSDKARQLRLAAAGRWEQDVMTKAEGHSTEADILTVLPRKADVTVDADRDFDIVLADTIAYAQAALHTVNTGEEVNQAAGEVW